jgi:D-3-phosphoglycerate dehydrogenase / 2-oxoglutarate reductase
LQHYINAMQTSYPKDKINILFLENISETAVNNFYQAGYKNIKCLTKALSEDELIKQIKQVHLLGIRSKTTITPKVLAAAEKLQAIGCFCIGINQVDKPVATQKGIALFNAPYSNTRSVAELVIGSSIMLMRRITDKNNAAHKGIWLKEATGSYELRGKTMGIIGYGNIGSQVSVLSEALGMKVVYYDVTNKLPLGNATAKTSLKEVLQAADVLSIHVPETASTQNLINKNNLKYCKKGAIIINYARGTVLDLKALAKALQAGEIGGAAIDVYPEEPEKNGDQFLTPLQGLPNVILTPHIGGSTSEAQQHIGSDVSQKLLNYLETGNSYGSHSVPELNLPSQAGAHRILHIHHNVPGVLSKLTTTLSKNNFNILSQYLKTNEDIGYVVFDVDKQISNQAVELLKKTKHTIKVRLLY